MSRNSNTRLRKILQSEIESKKNDGLDFSDFSSKNSNEVREKKNETRDTNDTKNMFLFDKLPNRNDKTLETKRSRDTQKDTKEDSDDDIVLDSDQESSNERGKRVNKVSSNDSDEESISDRRKVSDRKSSGRDDTGHSASRSDRRSETGKSSGRSETGKSSERDDRKSSERDDRKSSERDDRKSSNRDDRRVSERDERRVPDRDESEDDKSSDSESDNEASVFDNIPRTVFLKLIKKGGAQSVSTDASEEMKDIIEDFIKYMFEYVTEKNKIIESEDVKRYMELYLEDVDGELPEDTVLPRDAFEKCIQTLSERSRVRVRRDAIYLIHLFSECIAMKVVDGGLLVADACRRSRVNGNDLATSYRIYML
jgi:histone H3/H4